MNYDAELDELRNPMNIFYIARSPRAAAQAHCDKHVVKMILETAQLLSTAWHVAAPDSVSTDTVATDPLFRSWMPNDAKFQHGVAYYLGNQKIYAPTHEHHPSALWVRESRAAYDWAWQLGQELLDEYTYRYGREHASRHALRTLEFPPPGLPDDPLTEPPVAMPDHCVVEVDGYVDALASYRNYYRTEKARMLTYTRRPPPDWCADLAAFRTKKDAEEHRRAWMKEVEK